MGACYAIEKRHGGVFGWRGAVSLRYSRQRGRAIDGEVVEIQSQEQIQAKMILYEAWRRNTWCWWMGHGACCQACSRGQVWVKSRHVPGSGAYQGSGRSLYRHLPIALKTVHWAIGWRILCLWIGVDHFGDVSRLSSG